MSDSHGFTSNDPSAEHASDIPVTSKGKGKAVDETPIGDASMGEDDDSSDEEETDAEEPPAEVEEDDEDNMEEIDLDNILSGGRTRGKQIDYARAAEEAKEKGEELDDDDEDDDEDFQANDEDAMQE